MIRPQDKDRLFATIAAVALSVFLFACGGSGSGWATRSQEPAETTTAPSQEEGTVSPDSAPSAATEATSGISAASVADTRPPWESGESRESGESGEPAESAPSFGAPVELTPAEAAAPRPATPFERPSRGRVFSNKDLERYREVKKDFGFRDNVVVVDLTKKPDQSAAEESQGMTRNELEAEMKATQQKITSLIPELEYQKKRLLPLENPFVPRPQVSEQDKLDEAGMDNAERLQRVKTRIGEIEGEINALQRRLAELQNMKPSDQRGEPDAAPARDRE